jgi:hypothetical protein
MTLIWCDIDGAPAVYLSGRTTALEYNNDRSREAP